MQVYDTAFYNFVYFNSFIIHITVCSWHKAGQISQKVLQKHLTNASQNDIINPYSNKGTEGKQESMSRFREPAGGVSRCRYVLYSSSLSRRLNR